MMTRHEQEDVARLASAAGIAIASARALIRRARQYQLTDEVLARLGEGVERAADLTRSTRRDGHGGEAHLARVRESDQDGESAALDAEIAAALRGGWLA